MTCPPPGDLHVTVMEPRLLLLCWQAGSFPLATLWAHFTRSEHPPGLVAWSCACSLVFSPVITSLVPAVQASSYAHTQGLSVCVPHTPAADSRDKDLSVSYLAGEAGNTHRTLGRRLEKTKSLIRNVAEAAVLRIGPLISVSYWQCGNW